MAVKFNLNKLETLPYREM